MVMLIERSYEIKLLNIAYTAREHIFFLGPPGVAKSMMIEHFAQKLGKRYFRVLLSRFSTPEEIFGIPDLQKWKEGIYVRCTEGFLPSAEIAFIDEIFKANSSILNSLLTILEERIYFQNGKPEKTPIEMVVSASNELPEKESNLEALYDRFLLRHYVKPAQDKMSLLRLARGEKVGEEVEVKPAALASIGDDMLYLIEDVYKKVSEFQYISDRRLFKSVKIVQAAAGVAGREKVQRKDLWILKHVFCHDPEKIEEIEKIVDQISNPYIHEAKELIREAQQQLAEAGNDPKSLYQWGHATVPVKERLERLAELDDEIKELYENFVKFRQKVILKATESL